MRLFDGLYIVGGGDIGLSHQFDCNIYLIDGGDQMALIDSGVGLDTARIIDNIESEGKDPSRIAFILITHAHPDHAGGAAFLSERLGCDVMAAKAEAEIIRHGSDEELGLQEKNNDDYLPGYRFRHVNAVEISERNSLSIGDIEVTTILTPGHSICSTCYYFKIGTMQCLCSGDTVFVKGLVGLLNCHGFSMDSYRNSIAKLRGLAIDALLPGHLAFTIGQGQRHIDMAVEQFSKTKLPRHIGLLG
jgi:glyoxylase-like metal-dependent hydrolase (beta-lactamase superfamily II)